MKTLNYMIATAVAVISFGAIYPAYSDVTSLHPTFSTSIVDNDGLSASERRIIVSFTLPEYLAGKTIDLAEIEYKVSQVEELIEGYQLALIPLKDTVNAEFVDWESMTNEAESNLEVRAARVGSVSPQTTRDGTLNVSRIIQDRIDRQISVVSFVLFPTSAQSNEFGLDNVSGNHKMELMIYYTQD